MPEIVFYLFSIGKTMLFMISSSILLYSLPSLTFRAIIIRTDTTSSTEGIYGKQRKCTTATTLRGYTESIWLEKH
jgi:hypothetical protein